MTALAVAFAVLLGILVYALLPGFRSLRAGVSVLAFLTLVLILFNGVTELLGRPKPLFIEWRSPAKAVVVAAMPVENVAIYAWLILPGETVPRAYTFPWSTEAAQQLGNAQAQAEAEGGNVEVEFGEGGEGGEPVFHTPPVPPLPVKGGAGAPMTFDPPAYEPQPIPGQP